MAGTDVGMGDTLEINNVDIGTEALTLDGGKLAGTGAGAVADGTVALTAASAVGGAGTLDLGGIISGVGFGIDKQDGGTVILGGASTYTGATTASAGTLQLDAADRIADGSSLVVDGGSFDMNSFDMNSFDEIVAEISGTGGGITSAAAAELAAGGAGDTSYDGDITGMVELTKSGAGTLTLNGANTYSGDTNINDGTLQAGVGANAIGDTSAVILSGTGTLDVNARPKPSARSAAAPARSTSARVLAAGT